MGILAWFRRKDVNWRVNECMGVRPRKSVSRAPMARERGGVCECGIDWELTEVGERVGSGMKRLPQWAGVLGGLFVRQGDCSQWREKRREMD
jgi:hypothetical protein